MIERIDFELSDNSCNLLTAIIWITFHIKLMVTQMMNRHFNWVATICFFRAKITNILKCIWVKPPHCSQCVHVLESKLSHYYFIKKN